MLFQNLVKLTLARNCNKESYYCDHIVEQVSLPNIFQTMTSVSTFRSTDTLWLTCALMCQSSFYRKTSLRYYDVNPEHYSAWTALQKMVYRNEISHTDWLKRVLIDCRTQLSLDTLNQAINQLPKN